MADSYCLTSVAADTWGQLSPLKFSKTVCVYWSWCSVEPSAFLIVSIQKMASTCTACAFGPPAAPCRKAMFVVPPPEEGGMRAVVEIFRVSVETIFFPAIPCASTTFGLFTIACVTWGMSAGGVRNWVGTARFVSGNGVGVCGGAIVNGVMLTGAKVGA